jgi:flagellar export protein FliJ
MKKFVFSLAKLKNYREKMADTEKNTLGILRKELYDLHAEKENILRIIDNKRSDLQHLMTAGTNPIEIRLIKQYVTVCQQNLYLTKEKIAKKEEEVQQQIEIVIEAEREVSKLEKLEEVQFEEYKMEELKENEIFIEEFVSNSDFRKKRQD